jgi:pimeloyl-ACP methyl ester carboxylesterase
MAPISRVLRGGGCRDPDDPPAAAGAAAVNGGSPPDQRSPELPLIAHDLPYHGKSLPPASGEWWKRGSSLTQDFFMKFIVAFARELGLDRPVYMGCSMGGHLAGDLALHYPETFRAVIGVEGALASKGPTRSALVSSSPLNESKPSLMHLMAPQSQAGKRETIWITVKVLCVFKGISLLSGARLVDRAARHEQVSLLGGGYDWSASRPTCGRWPTA